MLPAVVSPLCFLAVSTYSCRCLIVLLLITVIVPHNWEVALVVVGYHLSKKNGGVRVCVDMNQVNKAVIPQRNLIPRRVATVIELCQRILKSRHSIRITQNKGRHRFAINCVFLMSKWTV